MPCEAGPPGTAPAIRPEQIDHQLIESSDAHFWTDLYSAETTSNECLTKIRLLLSCRPSISVARSFQGNEAQTFANFLCRVSELRYGFTPCPDSLWRQIQVLARSPLDDKLRQRGVLLLSKICKAQGIIPTPYVIQWKSIRVGRVRYHGGFADVSDGEYLGSPVAIKCLKPMNEDSDTVLKVFSINPARYYCSASD